MELEVLIAVPFLVIACATVYFFIVNSGRGINEGHEAHSDSIQKSKDKISQFDLFKVLYAGVVILIVMTLSPWIVFYVRSGSRLSFVTNYLTVLFVLSVIIFPLTYYFSLKKGEGR